MLFRLIHRIEGQFSGLNYELMNTAVKKAIYQTIDGITLRRGLSKAVNGETIRFKPEYFRYYPTNYEPIKQKFLRERCIPESTVIDAGAHIGMYSVFMSKYVGASGRVVAFEPTPATRVQLETMLKLNSCSNVEVRSEALWSKSGVKKFFDSLDPVSCVNGFADMATGMHYEVETLSLDELNLTSVSCIKIDVEGSEIELLKGASSVISKYRPYMTMEVHPRNIRVLGSSLDNLWELLVSYGYYISIGNTILDKEYFVHLEDICEVQLVAR